MLAVAQYPGLTGTSWVNDSEPQLCTISQQLDHSAGLAKFQQRAGQRLQFFIENHPLVTIDGEAKIYSAPALWRHDQPLSPLGTTPRRRGNRPFHIAPDTAEKMLHGLSQGEAAVLSYIDAGLSNEEQILTLAPAFLYPALKNFRSCVRNLTAFDPGKLDLVEIRFGYGQAKLGRQAQLRLSGLVDRIVKEPDVTRLKITGFTDSSGHAHQNLEMARMRALSVENYLLTAGISPDLLKRDQLGPAKPRYSNQTAAGRAGNRRVEIAILR